MTTSQVSPVTHLGSHGKGNAYRWVYEGLTEISLASPTVGDGKMAAAGHTECGRIVLQRRCPAPTARLAVPDSQGHCMCSRLARMNCRGDDRL